MHGVPELWVVVFEVVDIYLGIKVFGPLRDHGKVVSIMVHGAGLTLGFALEYNLSTVMLFIVALNLCWSSLA
jgi:hypothetical protein